jgi:hypothetical protein
VLDGLKVVNSIASAGEDEKHQRTLLAATPTRHGGPVWWRPHQTEHKVDPSSVTGKRFGSVGAFASRGK